MPRMEEQDQQLALSYGPEDAFTLHRYHRPPRGSTEPGGDTRPALPEHAGEPLGAATGVKGDGQSHKTRQA
jgi:hypothetical protein